MQNLKTIFALVVLVTVMANAQVALAKTINNNSPFASPAGEPPYDRE